MFSVEVTTRQHFSPSKRGYQAQKQFKIAFHKTLLFRQLGWHLKQWCFAPSTRINERGNKGLERLCGSTK